MGRQKNFNPAEKLDQAMRLFWEKGYHNTKLDTIVSELNLGKRSFYDTFGSKEELFVKSLERYFELGGVVIERLNRPDSSLQIIMESIEFMINFTAGDPIVKSCLMSNSILEMGNIHPEIKMKSGTYLDNLTSGFENALHNAIKKGEIKPIEDVRSLAMVLNTMYVGSNIMSRGGYSPTEIKKSVDMLFTLIRN